MAGKIISTVNGVELYYGDIDVPYKKIRPVEAETPVDENFNFRFVGDTIDPSNLTIEKVNFKVAGLAKSIGANAIINVEYRRDLGFTSLNAVFVKGEAIYKLSDEISCPECAEKIKRGAKKCRFCGAAIELPTDEPELDKIPSMQSSEPLRSDTAGTAFANIGCLFIILILGLAFVYWLYNI